MHDIESKGLRYSLAAFGLAASLMLLLASAYANFRYGCNLGRTGHDCMVWGTASAASDVLMAGSPFFLFAAWHNRNYTQALAAFIVWGITTAFAFQSALGHAALNRLDVVSKRAGVSTSYADVRDELKQARQERGFIPQHRNEATLKAEMERHKTSRMWSNTNECTEAAGKAAREYCATYQGLHGEMGYAQQATKLDERIAALTEKSDKLVTESPAVMSEADPGAQTVANMTGWDVRTTQGWLGILAVLMLLTGAGLGPYSSMSLLGVTPGRRKVTTIEGELVPVDPKDAKLALAPPQKVLEAQPILDKPLPIPQVARPDPVDEGKQLLELISYPRTRMKGPLLPKDAPRKCALRFLAWATAHKLYGEHDVEAFDKLFGQYFLGAHIEETGLRVVKPELESFTRFVTKSSGKRGTFWEIREQPIAKLIALLEKEKIITGPKPVANTEGDKNVIVPFSGAAGAEPDVGAPAESQMDLSARAFLKRVASLKNGLAWSEHDDPMLARAEKASWRERMIGAHRKQKNRMARNRSAA